MLALLFEVAPGSQQVERTDDPVVIRPGIVGHMGRYLTSVYPLPAEQVEREGVDLIPVQLTGEEPFQPRPTQKLGYGRGEAERVREPCYLAAHPKLLLEVPLSVEQLAYERLASYHL